MADVNKVSFIPNLSVAGCQERQRRLQKRLAELELEGALLCDRRHVYYFSGFWSRPIYAPMLLVERDGAVTLSAPHSPAGEVAADEVVVHKSARMGTLVEDQSAAARQPLLASLASLSRLGVDVTVSPGLGSATHYDLRSAIWSLRRRKDQDEIDLIRLAITATEASYGFALAALRPGITEVELFAGMLATAAEVVGEPIGEMGNDFQIGSLGGFPRRRRAEAGEMAVLDLAVVVRGYTSDLCRSFVVGGRPTAPQELAHERIATCFRLVEKALLPGVECRNVYQLAADFLDGYHGWEFKHHLGHGIGLSAHEAPRLNPHWTDTLAIGDVIAVEPGLYGDELRAGLRIEQVYYVGEEGFERLSSFPTVLA